MRDSIRKTEYYIQETEKYLRIRTGKCKKAAGYAAFFDSTIQYNEEKWTKVIYNKNSIIRKFR